MFASLRRAFATLFDRSLSGLLWTSIILTLLLFVVLIAAVEYGAQQLPTLGAPWVNTIVDILAPFLGIALIFVLGAPVAAFFGTLFLERAAKAIEARYYPADPKTSGASFAATVFAGLRLALLVFVIDLALLPLDEATLGVGEVVTIFINGWLLGRQYFELVAFRHMSRTAADALRQRHGWSVLFGGLILSILSVVPIADLFAPLFGVALMVHMYRLYAHQERPA